MENLIMAGGVYSICFAVFHLLFWRIFNWREDLQSLSSLNRSIMQVINFSLTFAFVIFGFISLVHSKELLDTSLGRSLLMLLALFWFLRAVEQIVFFKLKHWGSVAFLMVFLSGSLLYGIPAIFAT